MKTPRNNRDQAFDWYWPKMKKNIKFTYLTLSHDIDFVAVNEVLEGYKKVLEEMILDRFEPFWREVEEAENFAYFSFPFKGVEIMIRSWGHNDCLLDVKSLTLKNSERDIFRKFFRSNIKFKGLRSDVFLTIDQLLLIAKKEKAQIPEFTFKITNPEFSSDNLRDALGKGIDSKIARLVDTLNKVGLVTSSSCEGHTNWGTDHPWVDLPMIFLPPLLAAFYQLDKPFHGIKVMPLQTHFRIQPSEEVTLKEGQKLFNDLAEALEEKTR